MESLAAGATPEASLAGINAAEAGVLGDAVGGVTGAATGTETAAPATTQTKTASEMAQFVETGVDSSLQNATSEFGGSLANPEAAGAVADVPAYVPPTVPVDTPTPSTPAAPTAPASPGLGDASGQSVGEGNAPWSYNYTPVDTAPVAGPGIINSALGWAKENPALATAGLGVAAGFVKDAFGPSLEEKAKAQADALTQSQIDVKQWIQQSGSLKGVSFARLLPTGKTLDRSKVGLVRSAMR
jgi:hypothetical protein